MTAPGALAPTRVDALHVDALRVDGRLPGVRLEAVASGGRFTLVDGTGLEDGVVTVEARVCGWVPGPHAPDVNVVTLDEGVVEVRTSHRNVAPVHAWVDGPRLVLDTDLVALTAQVLLARGATTVTPADVRRARADVRRLEASTTTVFRAVDGAVHVTTAHRTEVRPHVAEDESPRDAGLRQIEALDRAVRAAATGGHVVALVSGGVDSGLVAALADRAGVLDGLATLGTQWGDERGEAEELGRHLGRCVQYVPLSEDALLAALPETVRLLGEPSAETVAITSNLVALVRSGELPGGTLLTGYGSDLLNSGMRTGDDAAADVAAEVDRQLAASAATGEFAGSVAVRHGYTLSHPFWAAGVVAAARATDPRVVRHRDREKGHLRLAAEGLLPDALAWRPKRALHVGSGVATNLAQAVARRAGTDAPPERLYAAIDACLVAADLHGRALTDVECLDRAVHLAASTSD